MRTLFLTLIASAFVTSAQADEVIGNFSIKDLHIRASLTNLHESETRFDLVGSFFALKWDKQDKYSAHLIVGSEQMRNLPVYYAATNDDKLGLVEAYAEYADFFGRFRFGLIPLEFGYDGVLQSYEQIFGRSLFFTQRVIGLRDQGISFYTEHRGYYTQFAIHNGEIDTAHDNRLWTSANWGFSNERNMRIQLSLQSGYVESALSAGSTNTLAGVTNGETARWRNGLFFVNWYPRDWNVVFELGGGELEQGLYEGRYNTSMFELSHQFSQRFISGLRYNQMDPNSKVEGDAITELSLLFMLKSKDSTGSIILQGTKVLEESNEIDNDQIRLVWVLTPITH